MRGKRSLISERNQDTDGKTSDKKVGALPLRAFTLDSGTGVERWLERDSANTRAEGGLKASLCCWVILQG